MSVSESGPVSLDDPYSAFIIPMMSSGSVFGGYYGFVKGGIWQITRELGRINHELGVDLELACTVHEVDTKNGVVRYENSAGTRLLHADHLVFATDPQTAARLTGDSLLIDHTNQERVLGTSGKLNLMFRSPVQWKLCAGDSGAHTAFRYMFAVDTMAGFDDATRAVVDGEDFVPGYYQVYCEGAAMRQMGLVEPFDRLAVFFKNLALGENGRTARGGRSRSEGNYPELCRQSRRLRLEPAAHAPGFAASLWLSGRQHRTHHAGSRTVLFRPAILQ